MDPNLLAIGAKALKKAALNEDAKEFILSNETLFKALKKAAYRYIGGETLEETIDKVKLKNQQGFKCSIEFMGENTRTEKEANRATAEFIRICTEIERQKINTTVSLDLSHIGLAVSPELGFHNLSQICDEASKMNTEVIISAEGIDRTDQVINIYKAASRIHTNIGITLQAYLHRSKDDFKELIAEKGRIRIVKGAFETPPGQSLQRGEALDEVYLNYVDQLLSQRHMCAIATHHDKIQQEVKKLIHTYAAKSEVYEFESLFGIQNEQLATLKNEGYPAKLYFVYGKEWYLYVCNRIAEYPLAIFQALNDIVN
jgi:proline dehydrogenase